MAKLHLDIETASRCELRTAGLYRYAEDPSTEILVVCYAFDDGSVQTWIPGLDDKGMKALPQGVWVPFEPPQRLFEHIRSGGVVCAHNAAFERTVLNGPAGQRIGFPRISIEQTRCTAAKAAAHGLPRALKDAAKALGTHPKDEVGQNDMRYCTKPRRDGTMPTPAEEPERFAAMYRYCADDVRAERDIDNAVPDLSPYEQRVYELDQRINDRGVKVDLERVADAQFLIDEYKRELYAKCKAWTGLSPTQTGRLADWCRDHGYFQLPDLQVPTVKEAIEDPECPPDVKRVLKLFSTYNMKAVSKYAAIQRAVCKDGRLHGMFLYHGAGTGRWASMIVQLQNLYRPVIDDPETAIEAFALRDLDWLRSLYPGVDPMRVLASCVRGMLIAEDGKVLQALDFASIEARKNAWFAGQEDKLEVFRTHGMVYEHTASKMFHIPLSAVTKPLRFRGKIVELSMGYQGGEKAVIKMGRQYGVDIDPVQAVEDKIAWREANPRIVEFWDELESSAKGAVSDPGKIYGAANKRILFKVEGQWLYMRLPSGRRIAYFRPQIDSDGQVTYLGIDTYTRRWTRCKTYGGRLCENACSGSCRDLLVNAMLKLEAAGHTLVGSVHDECIAEVDEDFSSLREAEHIMCELPRWAAGLPIGVEGFRAKRYRK